MSSMFGAVADSNTKRTEVPLVFILDMQTSNVLPLLSFKMCTFVDIVSIGEDPIAPVDHLINEKELHLGKYV